MEKISEETPKEANSYRLREISRLGKLCELKIGQKNPAYSRNNVIEGTPVLPKEFDNLQIIIPNSE